MTGNLKLRMGLMTDAASGGSDPDPGTPLVWQYNVPDFQVYEDQLDYVIEMKQYVSYPSGDTVAWAVIGDATIDQTGKLTVDDRPTGDTLLTVTADNGFGPQSSNQFTVTVLEGATPALPLWGDVPSFYSVEGVGGGNTVPPPLNPAQLSAGVLSTEDDIGVEMLPYILNNLTHQIEEESWVLQKGGLYVSIVDQATGRLVGNPSTPVGVYDIQVSVRNAFGGSSSNVFTWEVLDNMGFIVDFSTAEVGDWGGLQFFRDSVQTDYPNHLAEVGTVPNGVPAMVGSEWTGSGFNNKGVTYGPRMVSETVPHPVMSGVIDDLSSLPNGGMELEACFQAVVRINGPVPADQFHRVFALTSESADVPDDPDPLHKSIAEIVLFTGTVENSFSLSVRTTNYDTGGPEQINGYVHAQGAPIPNLVIGDVIDFRGRIQKPNGEGNYTIQWWWYRNDETVINPGSTEILWPASPQIAAMDELHLAGTRNQGQDNANDLDLIYIRLVPTGYLAEEIINPGDDGEDPEFLFWHQPVPIITKQPDSIHFGEEGGTVAPVVLSTVSDQSGVVGSPVTFSVSVLSGDPVITFRWDSNYSGQWFPLDAPQNADLAAENVNTGSPRITLPSEPQQFSMRVTADNAANSPQVSSALATATEASAIPTGSTVALFTDIDDGVNSGWHSDPDKGAVVTIYGTGFGHAPVDDEDTNWIAMGDFQYRVPHSHIVEWNEPAYPCTVPGLMMITFHVPATVPAGPHAIVIHTFEGTGSPAFTAPLPFNVRDTGRIFYFDVNAAGSAKTGTFSDPFDLPGNVFAGDTDPVDPTRPRYGQAGDHYYFMDGTYGPADGTGGRVVFLYGNRAESGTAGNSVSMSAYPGEREVWFDCYSTQADDASLPINSRAIHGFGTPPKNYYRFSRLNLIGYYASATLSKSNYSWVVGCDCGGIQKHGAGSGDVGFGGPEGNDGIRFLGLSLHGGKGGIGTDHAVYPGGGAYNVGPEIAYCNIFDNAYESKALISLNWHGGTDRVAAGEKVAPMSIHHNVVDCRNPPESPIDQCTGIGTNGLQDDRELADLPAGDDPYSGKMSIYNNVLIGGFAAPESGIYGVRLHEGAGRAAVMNNTFIGWGGSTSTSALGMSKGVTRDDARPPYLPHYEIKGNIFQGLVADSRVQQNAEYPQQIDAADNWYHLCKMSTALIGETTTDNVGDPLLVVDSTTPGQFSIALSAASPARATASSYGYATHDLYHREYDIEFASGAVIAEDAAE